MIDILAIDETSAEPSLELTEFICQATATDRCSLAWPHSVPSSIRSHPKYTPIAAGLLTDSLADIEAECKSGSQMLAIALNIFLAIFGVIATLIGSIGAVMGIWLWVAAEFLDKPVKVNGTDGPLNWSKRMFLWIIVVGFATYAAFGLWLIVDDWFATYLASGLGAIPWWTIPGWFCLCWLIVVAVLTRWSGWPKLSRAYPGPRGDALATRKLPWAIMGSVTAQNIITISAYDDGLGISMNRFFGPLSRPILVPWSSVSAKKVEGVQPAQFKLQFDEIDQAQLTLREECWQPIEQYKPND